jgi:transcriptional regulator with XRE-family HTH domain
VNSEGFKEARRKRGYNQQQAAARLGVSQAYLSMLENGKRSPSLALTRKLMRLYRLPPTVLPASDRPGKVTPALLAAELAALGYPGFAHLRMHRPKRNPAEVLLAALLEDHLEARLTEALPWVLLRYWDADWTWLVEQSKFHDAQNRLGFVVSLARRKSQEAVPPHPRRTRALMELESGLDKSRLAKEDTLGRPPRTPAELEWVLANRTEDAKHWNLLTDWRPEHLPHAF